MKKVVFYIVRPAIANLAAEKKVSSICTALQDNSTIVVIRTLCLYCHFRVKYDFPLLLSLPFILPDLLLSLIKSVFLLLKYYRYKKIVLAYNSLIDTYFVSSFLAIFGAKRWWQIEEVQSFDMLSSNLARFLSSFISRTIRPELIITAKKSFVPLHLRNINLVELPGTFSSDHYDAKLVFDSLNFSKISDSSPIDLFFSGRLDSQRGIDIIFKLIPFFHDHFPSIKVRWIICGYGSKKAINLCNSMLSELDRNYSCLIVNAIDSDRPTYLSYLSKAHICFNFIKDPAFEINSLPSKLIEYLAFGKIVISSYNTTFLTAKSHIVTGSLKLDAISNAIEFIYRNFDSLHEDAVRNSTKIRNDLSHERISKKLSSYL